MKEEKIISILIGLVSACNNNPKTTDTDNLIVKALSFPLIGPNADTAEILDMVNEILYRNKESDMDYKILYKGLSYINYYMEKSGLKEFLEEIKSIEYKTRIKEDL